MNMHRRSLITGLISFVAAPAIVRAANLMPVKAVPGLLLISRFDGMYHTVWMKETIVSRGEIITIAQIEDMEKYFQFKF